MMETLLIFYRFLQKWLSGNIPKSFISLDMVCGVCYNQVISPAVIPISAKNPDLSAFVLQATSEASTNTTREAYYDVVLTYHQLRDEESGEMLDLIFDNFTLDPCDLYQWTGIITSIRNAFHPTSGSTSLSSLLASTQKAITTMMNQTISKYEKIK